MDRGAHEALASIGAVKRWIGTRGARETTVVVVSARWLTLCRDCMTTCARPERVIVVSPNNRISCRGCHLDNVVLMGRHGEAFMRGVVDPMAVRGAAIMQLTEAGEVEEITMF